MTKGRSDTRDDVDRVKGALHKLKAENRKLRKENGQLKKELGRISEAEFDRQIAFEDEDDSPLISIEIKAEVLKCPKCKSEDFRKIPAGIFVINVCSSCGHRKRLKSQGLI